MFRIKATAEGAVDRIRMADPGKISSGGILLRVQVARYTSNNRVETALDAVRKARVPMSREGAHFLNRISAIPEITKRIVTQIDRQQAIRIII